MQLALGRQARGQGVATYFRRPYTAARGGKEFTRQRLFCKAFPLGLGWRRSMLDDDERD